MITMLVVCMIVGIVFIGFFEETNPERDWSKTKLTKKEERDVIKIALSDWRVKERLKGKEYEIEVMIVSGTRVERGEKISWSYPTARIYLEGDSNTIWRIDVFVDLDRGKVIDVHEYPLKAVMPRVISDEEREEAIEIALRNESVREKIEGLDYEIVDVIGFKKWIGDEIIDTQVYIHIKGSTICYIAVVDPIEEEVRAISQSYWYDKEGSEKASKAAKIALNDSRIKERIKGDRYEITTSNKLVDKKVMVDVYIGIRGSSERYVATVDTKEWKVIDVWEITPGTFFERGREIR